MDGRENMKAETSTKLTYEDLLLFPDDGRRHELIDGEHFVTPAPVTRHQRILRRLAFAIENWLQSHPAGEMFFAPFDVILSSADVVEPDLLFVSAARAGHVRASGIFGAPDLVVEILSPTTRRTDEIVKRRLYERAGVTEYWLIDPELDVVTVYRGDDQSFDTPMVVTRRDGDVLTTRMLPGLEIPLETFLA